jgi:signal transduction histidine kinase
VPGAEFQSFGEIKLNKEQELVLYRCAYELVNNAMKHANASHILIQLIQEPKQITLTVSDNGKGIAEGTKGMGLQNIRERIEPYHGEMQVISPEGQGTEINITQPL